MNEVGRGRGSGEWGVFKVVGGECGVILFIGWVDLGACVK